jgi:hypothetical protein
VADILAESRHDAIDHLEIIRGHGISQQPWPLPPWCSFGVWNPYGCGAQHRSAPFGFALRGVNCFRNCLLAPSGIRESMNTNLTVNPIRRLAYAFVGLLAGIAILLLFLLQNAFRVRAMLLAAHMGEPARQISYALQVFVLYAIFSFVGWVLVGLPTALAFPARSITRLSWPLRVVVGAALGPLALFAIFVLLAHGHINSLSFTGTSVLWAYSILVSTVSFVVYVALLGKEEVAEHT